MYYEQLAKLASRARPYLNGPPETNCFDPKQYTVYTMINILGSTYRENALINAIYQFHVQ